MGSAVLSQIEEMIDRLSPDEQMGLIVNLTRRLQGSQRSEFPRGHAFFKGQLAVMAEDPQVQDELKAIRKEFAATESDGLDGE